MTPRGIVNCNPGNIRRSGDRFRGEVRPSRDPAFKQFRSPAWGYRAIFVVLNTYRRRYGIRTLRGIVARWAPPSENRTDVYLAAVCRWTGLGPDDPLDTRDGKTMSSVAAAISRMENGRRADPAEVAAGWRLFEQG